MSNETRNTVAPSDDGISFTDAPDKVTVTITGAAFANLREIADVFNRTTGESLTPSDILAQFGLTVELTELARCKDGGAMQTLPAFVCDGCETFANELAAAFKAAGFVIA